mmetsp:Transcript_21322/g.45381  ORF Transcript_21322/g.45381 Transcript_21322/m.45381 type:complete len:240 (-) Transcript_21322:369-1088(-)
MVPRRQCRRHCGRHCQPRMAATGRFPGQLVQQSLRSQQWQRRRRPVATTAEMPEQAKASGQPLPRLWQGLRRMTRGRRTALPPLGQPVTRRPPQLLRPPWEIPWSKARRRGRRHWPRQQANLLEARPMKVGVRSRLGRRTGGSCGQRQVRKPQHRLRRSVSVRRLLQSLRSPLLSGARLTGGRLPPRAPLAHRHRLQCRVRYDPVPPVRRVQLSARRRLGRRSAQPVSRWVSSRTRIST